MNNSYYKFSQYLKDRFGERVQKICVDAGFSCPNRDGKVGTGGCIYCDVSSFSPQVCHDYVAMGDQITKQIVSAKNRNVRKYMLYFQSFSNTYDTVENLKAVYNYVTNYSDVVALAIGTRPDCIDQEKLELINSYTDHYEVWIEYGLQTIHDTTLNSINRGHTFQDFDDAYQLTRKFPNIKICVHTILGLPGESREDMLATAKYLAKIGIDGVKIHPLHIVKGTKLAEIYDNEPFPIMSMDEYIDLVVEFINILPKETVVQRIGADLPAEKLVAPDWILDKQKLLQKVDLLMSSDRS